MGQPIVPANTSGQAYNYWWTIINSTINSIDLVIVQAYNNWQDGLPGGSLSYFQDVYYHWRNILSPFCQGCQPFPNFGGVPK